MNNISSLITATPGVVGGKPRINNTRISVNAIAGWYRQGYSAEDIVEQYQHLTLAQIYAALTYYHTSREEIDRDILAEESEYDRLSEEYSRLKECA